MQHVLVTGGMGFIGSHTVVCLMEAGFEPVIFDNLCNSDTKVLEGIARIAGRSPIFIQGDVTDSAQLDSVFEAYPIRSAIHFAALKAVGESVSQPLRYYRNNIGGLLELLAAMQRHSVQNIVFSSSATVYGEAEKMPVTEDTPLPPALSPYGSTKQMGERILQDDPYFQTVCLRYFNPIGAHPSGLIGELPLGIPNNLAPYVTQAAAGLREALTVFGDDYPTPDGTAVRDYLHVMDLAEAHVAALRFLDEATERSAFEVFNLGTGRAVSVKELLQAFERVNGIAVPHRIGARRQGDVTELWANPSLAEQRLGWKAERSLDDMLRDAWNWQLRLVNQ
jgi:UDP-glucose 4-epimerase